MKLPIDDTHSEDPLINGEHDPQSSLSASDEFDFEARPVNELEHTITRKPSPNRWMVAVVVALLVGTVGLGAMYSTDNETTSDPSTLLDSERITPYISSEHGFTVDFPGFPTTEHSDLDIDGIAVPYTQYSTESKDGREAYMAQVAKYPEAEFDMSGNARGALDGAINGMAQSMSSEIVSSSNSGTFLGHPSAEAVITMEYAGQQYDVYTLNFVKDNDLYTLMTMGVSRSSFDAFVDSFEFN